MKRRAFMTLGAASIGVGALHHTGAFSSLSAGRGIAVSAADDPNGLLGIDNVDTTDDPVFTNNTSQEMEVTLEEVDTAVTFDGDPSPVTFSLDPDESESVEVETDGDAENALVDIIADLLEGDGSTGTIELQRDFSVPQAEVVEFTGEADTAGASGDFEFTLRNVGDIPVTFTGIGINATTTDAVEVSQQGNQAVLVGEGQDLVTETIEIDSTDPDSDTRYEFDDDLELEDGDDADFEFNRFRDGSGGGGGVDMRGENVRVTVYFGDDSHKTIDLCLDETTCGEY